MTTKIRYQYGFRCGHTHYSGTRCGHRYTNGEEKVCGIHRGMENRGDDACKECLDMKQTFGLPVLP